MYDDVCVGQNVIDHTYGTERVYVFICAHQYLEPFLRAIISHADLKIQESTDGLSITQSDMALQKTRKC